MNVSSIHKKATLNVFKVAFLLPGLNSKPSKNQPDQAWSG
jgi:hypothetical protein